MSSPLGQHYHKSRTDDCSDCDRRVCGKAMCCYATVHYTGTETAGEITY